MWYVSIEFGEANGYGYVKSKDVVSWRPMGSRFYKTEEEARQIEALLKEFFESNVLCRINCIEVV